MDPSACPGEACAVYSYFKDTDDGFYVDSQTLFQIFKERLCRVSWILWRTCL